MKNMKEIESVLPTSADIIKTWKILSPDGSSPEQVLSAMRVVLELYESQFGRVRNTPIDPTKESQ